MSLPKGIISDLIEMSARYNLANTDFRLLLMLFLQEEGQICDSMANLADQMNVPIRTLRRSVARLEKLNLIHREPGRGRIPTCLRLEERFIVAENGEAETPAGEGAYHEDVPQEVIDTLADFIAQSLPNMPTSTARSLALSDIYRPLADLMVILKRIQENQALRVPPARDVTYSILTQFLGELEAQS